MRVPGKIFADKRLMDDIHLGQSIQQVANVAHLPGILSASLAMPDIHWGYGFPIGGVAAMDAEEGVISPGGVGYDINCGVRFIRTSITRKEIMPKIRELVNSLYNAIPTGVGSSSSLKLTIPEEKRLLTSGAEWAVERGFGTGSDLERIEENGRLKSADPSVLSKRALERGASQIGTLGSGNHFLEIGYIDEIYDEKIADTLGLQLDNVSVIIHTGSRGFGYQVCDDNLKVMMNCVRKYGIELPDRQLACTPIKSDEGRSYFAAMSSAANYAWANRQVIMHWTKKTFYKVLNASPQALQMNLVYDLCHNIAKFEEYEINGKMRKVCVHRKGATRALPPGHPNTPDVYKSVGQPVLIPGDMGRYSYVLIGTEQAVKETFGSTCHGAGRQLSRRQAVKACKGRNIYKELEEQGIIVQSHGRRTVLEEIPEAYKDVKNVVDVVHNAGISKKVARHRPLGVIKG
ncbi:RtcB family protein [candidate division KSB1 bacterium]|nr:RtcB family protein [candidate division KSB1 bacterium]